jgi:hypothetical protein
LKQGTGHWAQGTGHRAQGIALRAQIAFKKPEHRTQKTEKPRCGGEAFSFSIYKFRISYPENKLAKIL